MIFFHRVPGAKFYMPDGKEISFAGGELDTSTIKDTASREAAEHELRKIADSPQSMIFTRNAIPDSAENAVAKEIRVQAETASDGVNKTPGGAVTIPVPQPQTITPALNPDAAAGSAGVMAAKIEAARKAVEGSAKSGTAGSSSHTPRKTP